jgi:AAA15 family ATPase/GTPase
MLVSLQISNFLSFREPVTFSTRATRERQHGHRVFSHPSSDLKLVPIAALFGSNASGKSNFYRAVQFLRHLVLRQPETADEQVPVEPFRLDDGASESLPCRFVIEILPKDTLYRLTVAVLRDGIVEEQLEEVRGERIIPIYSRVRKPASRETSWNSDGLQRRAPTAADRDFIGFKTRDTLPNQLFLGALRGKGVPVIDEVTSWFSDQLALMLPSSTFKLLEFNLPTTRGLLEFCNEALRTAGTGVHEIHPESVLWQDFPAPPELKEQLKKNLGERQITFILSPDGRRFSITRRNGQLHVARLFTHHKSISGGSVRFELANESEGTQRYIDLLPAFFEMVRPGRPKVFIIDELDRSLHTQLSKHLVQSYLRAMDLDSRSQLIFTTHDVTLLDQEMLRRDEIWFVEKQPEGMSTLKSLASFEGIRYDKDIRRGYLDGNFGGVPRIAGPAFKGILTPRKLHVIAPPAAHRQDLAPVAPDPLAAESFLNDAYPATTADRLVCELAVNLIDLKEGITSEDHLSALILATHPDLCRILTSKKPTRKTDALFDSIRTEADTIAEQGIKWSDCITYLEQHRHAISLNRSQAGRPMSKGAGFDEFRLAFPARHMPLSMFAVSVLDSLKQTRAGKQPSAERASAMKTFDQLRANFVYV